MAFDLMTTPSWAPTWCYLYFIAALLGAVSVLVAFVVGFKKMNAMTMFALLFAGTIMFIDAMMYFWICRAALN